jgi:hypothetical protein
LHDATRVPQVLEDTNAGQPLPPVETALALDLSPRNSGFEQITSASIKYGITTGSSRADEIAVTELGQRIVAPASSDDKAAALLKAALLPDTFRQMYEFFKGKKIPEEQFLLNTIVREFSVPREHAAKCAEVFGTNMEYVGLIKTRGDARYLSAQAKPVITEPPLKESDDEPHDAGLEAEEEFAEDPGSDPDGPRTPPIVETKTKKRPRHIFVGHGRNKKPLHQLTKTLDNLGIPYLVAEDEPNVGRPISQKVRDTMEECGAAILVFSADDEYFDKEQNSVWKNSENVSHELGAASVMYDNRIILFKEETVQLASNFSGIGYISFEKDNLDAKVNELLRELVALKLLKLSFGDE